MGKVIWESIIKCLLQTRKIRLMIKDELSNGYCNNN